MIYGNPSDFAIQIEALCQYKNNNFSYGLFNIIINDLCIPDQGSDWTISLIVSWLKGTLAEIEAITEDNYFAYDSSSLFHMARKSRGEHWHGNLELPDRWWLSNDPAVITVIDSLPKRESACVGVEIPFAEINDLGWYFYLFQTGDRERIIFSGDYGKTVHEKYLQRGSVAQVIRSLPEFF